MDNFEVASSLYNVECNLEENKIFIRAKNYTENKNRRIQIFSPARNFPFLYAGSIEVSTEFNTWIELPSREDFLDWKRGGCIIRLLLDSKIEEEIHIDTFKEKTKVLFVAPHLSTGGCPQYLLKKIETYKDVLDIYVIEYNFLGSDFVVQRNKIIDLLKDRRFFTLEEEKDKFMTILKEIEPEILHFEEIPETFVDINFLQEIYKKDRKYFITETTHSSGSLPEIKRFIPDKFIFCSKYSQENFSSLNVPSEVWEYPIEIKERPIRKEALKMLNMDPSYVHILNVGLFTPGKNQGELLKIAKNFTEERVKFHFVGNRAQNFQHYWEKLEIPENCVLWGERNDVDSFMAACDIFYFSSVFELNPLVVKEALSWKMPILMYNLSTYMSSYDKYDNITFLKNITDSENLLRAEIKKLNLPVKFKKTRTAKIVHIISEIDGNLEKESIASISKLASEDIEYTIHYNPICENFPESEPLRPNENLRPGHYGCFEAFRKAIVEDFSGDQDFLIVCERDCILEKSVQQVQELLQRTFLLMEKEELLYFSFGDKVDLDHGFMQSEKIRELSDFAYLTDKIIGLQFVIFSKRGIDFLKEKFKTKGWYGMDIWLNIIFEEENKHMGILNERVTTQLDGYSLIDKKIKKFKGNEK